ncbi:hypothetical protein R3P38DRAFT_2775837 [Favolaschia claudopus]|uniref:Uncharacterized protein n=1 Tax=Favolaschia claudopus TaxID=2862362 RepID=A0AAW0BR12_9AGAR
MSQEELDRIDGLLHSLGHQHDPSSTAATVDGVPDPNEEEDAPRSCHSEPKPDDETVMQGYDHRNAQSSLQVRMQDVPVHQGRRRRRQSQDGWLGALGHGNRLRTAAKTQQARILLSVPPLVIYMEHR